jgi:MFS family permease
MTMAGSVIRLTPMPDLRKRLPVLGASPTAFVLLYGFLGFIGAGHSTLTYGRAVSTWFDAKRGLALGVTLAGIGIGAAVIPKYTYFFVANCGWREAYFALGALLFLVGFPSVALFVRIGRRKPAPRPCTPTV